jgi:uncharacterized RDD family membrane protein YckC
MGTGPWFYVEGGQQRGPVRGEELAGWILSARLPADVQVWREGLAQWAAAESQSDIIGHVVPAGLFLAGPTGPQGPLDPRVVVEMARAGRIGRETLVWREGTPDWITAGSVPELAPWLPATAAPRAPSPPRVPAAPRRPKPGAEIAAPAVAFVAAPAEPAARAAAEPRPVVDRFDPCPLCGSADKMGTAAKQIDGGWVCRRCHTGFANRRQLAFALDLVLLWLAIIPASFVVGVVTGLAGLAQDTIEFLGGLTGLGAYVLFLFKDGFGGRSPGKMIMGVRVLDQRTEAPAGLLASFKRNLPLMIPLVPLIVATQVGSGQRIGDGWAHTRVVWDRHRGKGPF